MRKLLAMLAGDLVAEGIEFALRARIQLTAPKQLVA